jgi:hypothetical protein
MDDIKKLQEARLTSSKEKKIGGWLFKKSNRKGNKYDVYDPKTGKYLVSFGDARYEHFKDKIGFWSHKDHNDPKRRELYKKRHGTNPKRGSAGYFALNYLW